MSMTAKKAAIIGVVSAGLVTVGLITAPANAETISGPYTMTVGPDITDVAAYVGANCHARGESLKEYTITGTRPDGDREVTYSCVAPTETGEPDRARAR